MNPFPMPEPRFVALAGDWHRNGMWGSAVLECAAARLAELGESDPCLIQLGDFGYWPGLRGWDYLERLNLTCETYGIKLFWVDGNHEHHERLREVTDHYGFDGPAPIRENVFYLPRGFRWKWNGRVWVAIGGAVSVDKSMRTPHIDWFPGEVLDFRYEYPRIVEPGPADVVVAHDCPSSADIEHILMNPKPSWMDPVDLYAADVHRKTMQRVVDEIKPTHWFHGHYHGAHDQVVDQECGPKLHVRGLAEDGSKQESWGIFDTRTMEWRGR